MMTLFLRTYFFVIGSISSILTILAFFKSDFPSYYVGYVMPVYFAIFAVGFIITLYILRELNSINILISDTAKLTIKYGDLFQSKGVIVIPVNDYFDVIVDDEVISRNTLHGKWIEEFYSNDIGLLNSQIEEQLSNYSGKSVPNRKNGRKVRYPLGTTIKIQRDDQLFFLVAFTKFDENNRAQLSNLEYQETVIKLIEFIENNSNGYQINLPLVGAGHSGVQASKQRLLEFLIFSLKIKNKLTLINGINIVLANTIKKDVSLKLIKYYYDVVN